MTDTTNKNVQPELGKNVRETVLTCKPNLLVENSDKGCEMTNSFQELKINDKDGIQTVSARELYKRLEITDRFNRWFESLLKYGFIENEDFTSVKTSTLVNNGAERELNDYAISFDMAKQICMLQRSEQGKRYRQYLINLEKAWNDPVMVMKRALEYANKRAEQLLSECAVMKPKAIAYDNYLARDNFCNFRDAANYLNIKQTDFMNLLKSKYIYKNSIGEYRAYSDYSNYFSLRPFERGKDKVGQQLMINIKGLEYFKKILAKEIIYA